jgi:hypothetical protein
MTLADGSSNGLAGDRNLYRGNERRLGNPLGRHSRSRAFLPLLVALGASAAAGAASPGEPLSVSGKLQYHCRQLASPGFAAETAAYAGVVHWMNTPKEWGQGPAAYGRRLASASGSSAIRSVFAFTLDSGLGEDPRYRPSKHGGFLARLGHAARETLLTHTDSGGSRVATWRIGSAFGSAFLSDVWYPDRLNTLGSGLEQGALTLGGDLLTNLASEFWPGIKHRLFRR